MNVIQEMKKFQSEKSKRRKSKHHGDTLFQYRWTARPLTPFNDPYSNHKGKKYTSSIFVPIITDGMRATDGWKVARTKPNNTKYKWSIIDQTGKLVRHPNSNRPMRFSSPAYAIIAAEKVAQKRYAWVLAQMTQVT